MEQLNRVTTTGREDGEIRPIDTLTPHGVITKGADGYPEKLTTYEAMRKGEIAPPPSGTPSQYVEGPEVGEDYDKSSSDLQNIHDQFQAFMAQPVRLKEKEVVARYVLDTMSHLDTSDFTVEISSLVEALEHVSTDEKQQYLKDVLDKVSELSLEH